MRFSYKFLIIMFSRNSSHCALIPVMYQQQLLEWNKITTRKETMQFLWTWIWWSCCCCCCRNNSNSNTPPTAQKKTIRKHWTLAVMFPSGSTPYIFSYILLRLSLVTNGFMWGFCFDGAHYEMSVSWIISCCWLHPPTKHRADM